MTRKETSNTIIKLREKGWTDTEINDFVLFITTHDPSEEEAVRSSERAK